MYPSSILYIITTMMTLIQNVLTCPSDVCQCKWKGGKQTVECGGQMLSNIPDGMDPGTQVLNFSSNSLQQLHNERFLNLDLINLQKIYLSRNQLTKIYEKSFRGLSNLVELDLSDNLLQHTPTETFQDYTSLMRLSLSGNPIRELKTSSFRHLSFLTTLELSNCQIEKIENEAFIGMDNLEWLRLDGNRISYIQGNHILPKALHGISLQNNKWQCDCRLIDLHAWLINYNTPQSEEPKCIEPIRLKGQVIKNLRKDELACLPEVHPKSTYTEVAEGRNISIQCIVRAIPEPKVLWLFNGQVLTNDTLLDNLHMFFYIDEITGGEEKRSEVIIYNVGPEDNGTFSCIGQNIAGTTFSNYTLRVIIKEHPVVNEVSFSKDYMNYIMISGTGFGCLLVLIVCTIAINCSRKTRTPRSKMTKQDSGGTTTTSETGILKCPSIINSDDEQLKENGMLMGGQGSTNGLISGPCQLKSGFMMYVPSMQIDNGSMQLNANVSGGPTPPVDNSDCGNLSQQYCSPPSSVRNYQQDKNPDLVNDAEKNQYKTDGGASEYDGSDCSGPCSIQGNFLDNCYQLQSTGQFGSQLIRPPNNVHRYNAMSTLPRGMQIKPNGSQHQVDVHLNPVCFLGQENYTYDFSNNHLLGNSNCSSQPLPQPQVQQQNFYRTLPHNRGGQKQIYSAANPGTRYSLEAEFLQRSGTPTYDKYVQNMRFTAEGYPVHPAAAIAAIVQYPSPPDGYKAADYSDLLNSQTGSFQQWPPCLPGFHVQPICYTSSSSMIVPPSQQQQQQPQSSSSTVGSSQQQSSQTQTTSNSTSPGNEVKKRCVGAQTTELEPSTIPECDEEQEGSTSSSGTKLRHLTGPLADSPDEGYVGDSQDVSSDV